MQEFPDFDRKNSLTPEPAHASGYVTGIIGALLGALIGSVPWFIASTFVGFYIGWLGFLVGWVSLWGYKALHGVKKTGYATAVIFTCSILSIVLADFSSNLYALLKEPEFLDIVEAYGLSKYGFAISLLFNPENLKLILPNLLIGLVIGVLGVISARKQISAYTAPEPVAQTLADVRAVPSEAAGFSLPHSFTVEEKRVIFVLGIICTLLFGGLGVVSIIAAIADNDPQMYAIAPVSLIFILLGVYCMMAYRRRKLEVAGERLAYTSWLGKQQQLSSSEISYIKLPASGRLSAYGRDGKLLFKIESNMTNFPLLTQYLANRNVGLRG